MRDPRSIVITGASSGIGAALAETYAGTGVHLALTGRHGERLAAVAATCRQKGAEVMAATLEVTDHEAMSLWLREIDRQHPIDLVIANAGISAGTGGGGESEAQIRAIFAVNLEGVLNTILPLLPALQARRRGQVALMSSLAAFRGIPGAPAYCASKAAVRVWGEALRGGLRDEGIEVSVICPGFVVSSMTAGNDFPMPLLMPAARAARIIRRGLDRGRARIAFPWPLYAMAWLLAALPLWLTDPLLGRLPKKKSAPSG
jgi:short-subunit dehydrogenase